MPSIRDVPHPLQLALFDDAPRLMSASPSTPPPAPDAQGPLNQVPPPKPAGPAAAPRSEVSSERAADAAWRHPRASREALLAGHRVAYELRRGRRRSIGFVVGPQGLSVSAPRWVGQGDIDSALQDKARWIVRKLQESEQRLRRMAQARIEWRDGTGVPFLGETVIVVLDPRISGAMLHTDAQALPGVPRLTLHVGLPQHAQAEQLREAVQGWLQRQARRIFEERCQHFAQRLGVRFTRLSLSSAATRWGSASADGSIRLNWRLVHFGMSTIDYVVAHELAHLREMNHSPAFWDVVRSVMPDFQDARGRLRQEVLPALD
jgi:predicted metal-dependent hydrolase